MRVISAISLSSTEPPSKWNLVFNGINTSTAPSISPLQYFTNPYIHQPTTLFIPPTQIHCHRINEKWEHMCISHLCTCLCDLIHHFTRYINLSHHWFHTISHVNKREYPWCHKECFRSNGWWQTVEHPFDSIIIPNDCCYHIDMYVYVCHDLIWFYLFWFVMQPTPCNHQNPDIYHIQLSHSIITSFNSMIKV